MSNFNYGHSNLFWELLIQAIEDETLELERKRVLLISPWIRDIPLSSSNLTAEDFRNLLGTNSGKAMTTLSDVLHEMTQIGFSIDIVTLDSADKRLPKNSRSWLKKEADFVQALQRKNINVWKKIGLHAKMYIFPHGALSGSTNLTNQGMFANHQWWFRMSGWYSARDFHDLANDYWGNLQVHMAGFCIQKSVFPLSHTNCFHQHQSSTIGAR